MMLWYDSSCWACIYLLVHSLDLINLQALPDDLKTKLSIDDDLVSSPKEALSRASADRRMKYLNRYCLFLAAVLYICNLKWDDTKNWIKKSIVLLEAHIFPPKWFYLYIFLSLVVEKKKKTQTISSSWKTRTGEFSHNILLHIGQRYITLILKSKGQEPIKAHKACC